MSKEVNILLVEDDKVDILAVKRAFQQCKVVNPLTVACDGVEALEILRGDNGKEKLKAPYIVILDLNMPRMNGLQFLKELRKDPQLDKSIVFVLTTSNSDKDRTSAYESHIAGYIAKADFDTAFIKTVSMLEAYSKIIEFP
ncbi:MAG: CheY-like chemotaxis protein [Planctomycetota bacterium]|jgi:CheY-like chemotaxis protein